MDRPDPEETDSSIEFLINAHPIIFGGHPPIISSHLPTKWLPLVSNFFSTLGNTLTIEELHSIRVMQIKEKFGTLRIRLELSKLPKEKIDLVRKMIDSTQNQSEKFPQNPSHTEIN